VRAAVTGAGGFIGSTLTAHLLELGWDVAALDLPRALGRVPVGARRIGVDIRNQSALREALRGVQILFHTAALFDLTAAWEDLYAVNVEGVGQVCAAARARRVERIISWSSSSVYGGTERPEPLAETAPIPFERLNPYARTKWLGELLAREAAITDGLDVIVVRPAEVYGPGSAKGLGQALFAFKTGAMSAVPGPGRVRHSYVHVEDVARAAVHLAQHGEANGVYNLASPTPISAADVYAMARRRLGWLSLRDARVTLPDRPRLAGRPLFHVPAGVLRLYARWEMLRARRGWLVGKFGPTPLANPAGVHLLVHNHVIDARKLLGTGFQLAWPDTRAGILATLDAYVRSGWAPFYASARVSAVPSDSPRRPNRPASAS
jgi:nucleoside-diphosphate-sugar epimerase